MDNVIDRLIIFQQSSNVGGQNKFEAYIGISNGYLSNMKKKGGAISSDVILKVLTKFPRPQFRLAYYWSGRDAEI